MPARRARNRYAIALLLVACGPAGASDFVLPALEPTPEAVRCALARATVRFDREGDPRFVLRYRGPLAPWRGPLCYRFAGYNESCGEAPERWLTPATDWPFVAPGQVPVDLLATYRLEVRAPQMFAGTLRYYAALDASGTSEKTPCPPP